MKKNKINIILISVVASIWILVALKANGNIFTKEDSSAPSDETVLNTNSTQKKLTNEKLDLNYPDPFLGKVQNGVQKSSNSNSEQYVPKKEKRNTEKEILNEFPLVKFFGLVRNTSNNKMVAILSVNNREKRLLSGESFNEIKLEKITRDSVLVSWGKDKRYIRK